MKKILSWLTLFVVIYLIANDPESATRLVSGTVDLISKLAEGTTRVIQGV